MVKKIKRRVKKNSLNNRSIAVLVFSLVLLLTTFIIINQAQEAQDIQSSAQTVTNCTVSDADLVIDSEEQKMLTLVNAHRQANGVEPLKFSPSLNRSAAWLSADMKTKKYLNHTDSLGRNMSKRLSECGVAMQGVTGENIASTGTTAESAFNGWKKSSGHNKNMLSSVYKTIGIARTGKYWTQDFSSGDDSGSGAIPSPSSIISQPMSIVPSQACMGSCPTVAVSVTAALNPTITTIQPSNNFVSNSPSISIIQEPTGIGEPVIEQPAGEEKDSINGLFAIILDLLKKLLEFILGIFGRN